jgi:hypothetical protein
MGERNGNPHYRYPCLRLVYHWELKAVIGYLFLHGGREADLARLSPRVKRAQFDWRVTVTLGCPR